MPRSPMDRVGAFVPAQSAAALAAPALILTVPAGLIVYAFDPLLVLPAFSVLLFAAAAVAVLLAALMKAARDLQKLTLWDIAGGFVITGCAASVLSEPDQVTLLFEHLFEPRSNARQE